MAMGYDLSKVDESHLTEIWNRPHLLSHIGSILVRDLNQNIITKRNYRAIAQEIFKEHVRIWCFDMQGYDKPDYLALLKYCEILIDAQFYWA